MPYLIYSGEEVARSAQGVEHKDLERARAQAVELSHQPNQFGIPITVRDEAGRLYGMFIDGVEVGEVLGGP